MPLAWSFRAFVLGTAGVFGSGKRCGERPHGVRVPVGRVFDHGVGSPTVAVPHRPQKRVVVIDVDDQEIAHHVRVRLDVALTKRFSRLVR